MAYNWELWDNFQAAAEELGLELKSKDGGCVYVDVPKDISDKFYIMCWTPLNKLYDTVRDYDNGSILGTWPQRLKNLRQNSSDFHLEFGAKHYEDGSMYWFPEFNIGQPTPSKQQIVRAIKMMMDKNNFDKYVMLAKLREPAEEYEAAE